MLIQICSHTRWTSIHTGIAFAALAALLIAWPWGTMTVGLLIYVASIPFAIFAHHPRYATKQISP